MHHTYRYVMKIMQLTISNQALLAVYLRVCVSDGVTQDGWMALQWPSVAALSVAASAAKTGMTCRKRAFGRARQA